MALRSAMRFIPRDRTIVTITVKPSGMAATANDCRHKISRTLPPAAPTTNHGSTADLQCLAASTGSNSFVESRFLFNTF